MAAVAVLVRSTGGGVIERAMPSAEAAAGTAGSTDAPWVMRASTSAVLAAPGVKPGGV
jgi:hypothetical protein